MEEKLVLVSGYGVPGEDDIALYGIAGERAVKRFGLYHGRAPSFCCKGDDGVVYVASERADGADITAYDIWEEGLRAIRTLEVPGRGLCHLCAHKGVVFGCCFESGHYFAVDAALTRVLWQFCPDGARAHWSHIAGGALFLADLENSCLYRFVLSGGLPQGEPQIFHQPEGSGPRQILTLEGGRLASVNELDGTVRILTEDGGVRAAVQASDVPEPRNWPGGACLDERGMLYVCNRGPNTLSAWRYSGEILTPVWEIPTGDWPRHVAALPGTGLVLAACTRGGEVCGYAAGKDSPREVFRLPLAGASCVLPL